MFAMGWGNARILQDNFARPYTPCYSNGTSDGWASPNNGFEAHHRRITFLRREHTRILGAPWSGADVIIRQ